MNEKVDELFAEAVARKIEGSLSPFLVRLMQASREGHLFLVAEENLNLPEKLFEEILHREEDRIYLKCNWECEKLFLEHLERIKKGVPEQQNFSLQTKGLLKEQEEAVKKALSGNLTLIVGGPGTGKTYTAKAIVSHFSGQVALCAPTGKATSNLRKHFSEPRVTIKTLHGLLQERYFPYDLIVVDEGSMIDAHAFAELFSLLKDDSRLVILGDKDQLPSVESGSFFADLVVTHEELVAELHTSLRAELQNILVLAKKVNDGEKIPFSDLPNIQTLADKVLFGFKGSLADHFQWLKDFRLLTPLRFGPYGVKELNRMIHERDEGIFVPIMITENDQELELYNGDIGFKHDRKVWFEDGRQFSFEEVPHHELAYVISVHKSQGSEFDEVMVVVPPGSESFGREMLYTAITRAKKKIEIFACGETLNKMIEKKTSRRSGLCPFYTFQRKDAKSAKKDLKDNSSL